MPLFAAQSKSSATPIQASPPSVPLLEVVSDLTPEQVEAVSLLVQGHPNKTICSALGVTADTLRRWQQDSSFQYALRYSRAEVLQHSLDTLRIAHNEAITLLRNIQADGSQTSATRIKAAGKLLDVAAKLKNSQMADTPTDDDGPVSSEVELKALAAKNPDIRHLLGALNDAISEARAADDA